MNKNYYVYSGMYLLYFFGFMMVALLGLAVYTSKNIFVFLLFLFFLIYFLANLCKIISYRLTVTEGLVVEKVWFAKKRELKIEEIKKISLSEKSLPVFSLFSTLGKRKWYYYILSPIVIGMEMVSFEKEVPNDSSDISVEIFPSLPVNPQIAIAIKELRPDIKIDGEITRLLPWNLKKKIGISSGDRIQLFFNVAFGIFFVALALYAVYFLFHSK